MIIQIGPHAECLKGDQQYFSRTTEFVCLCQLFACSGMVGPQKWLPCSCGRKKCNKFYKYPAAVISMIFLLYSSSTAKYLEVPQPQST